MTELLLLLIGLAASALVLLPIVRTTRRPWLAPDVSGEGEALRQEELTALEALRDLTMDLKLGNLSQPDYQALAAPLQTRLKQTHVLQAEQSRRQAEARAVDPDLDRLLEAEIQAARRTRRGRDNGTTNGATGALSGARFCHQCGAASEAHHRFCAACGESLRPPPHPASSPATTAAATTAAAHPAPVDAPANGHASAPVSQIPSAQDPTDKAGRAKPWIWWGAGVIALIWVAVVIGTYVNGRNSQTASVPLAQLEAPVETIDVAGNVVLLGTREGAQRSADGRTWVATELREPVLTAAALDESGSHWLAATMTGLQHSLDGGDTWQPLPQNSEQNAPGFVDLAALPRMGVVWGLTEGALYGSEDGGATWTLLTDDLPGRARALAVGPGLLYVGTDRGVYASDDGGQRWLNQNGSVNGRIVSLDVRTLAFDGANGMLYAGTPAGLSFLNTNVGGGWGQRSLQGAVTALRLDGENNQVLWVGTGDGRLFRSPDRGVTWD
jgi:hypothetical protein